MNRTSRATCSAVFGRTSALPTSNTNGRTPDGGEVLEVLAVVVQRRDDRLEAGPVHRPDVQDRLALLPAELEPILEDQDLQRVAHGGSSVPSAARARDSRIVTSPQANRKYRNQESE